MSTDDPSITPFHEMGNIEAVSCGSHCAENDLDNDAGLLLCSLETVDCRSNDLIQWETLPRSTLGRNEPRHRQRRRCRGDAAFMRRAPVRHGVA